MKRNEHLEKLIPFYLYDELNEEEKREFEVHLEYCEYCRGQLNEMRALHKQLDNKPILEPTDALLTRSRNQLRDRLQSEQKAIFNPGLLTRLGDWLNEGSLPMQLARGVAVLAVGFLVGRLTTSNPANFSMPSGRELAATGYQEESLPFTTSVDLIQYDPKTGNITVQYKSMKDISRRGNIDDPSIRQLLVHAIRSEDHPGRRLAAVKATGSTPFSDDDLEDALIYAMQNDEVDGVRLRAAKVLKNLPINQKIKSAFIRILLKDSNPAMRMEALTALSKVEKDEDVVPVFRDASNDDENEFVRLKASRALERLENPEIKDDAETKLSKEEKKQ